MPQTDERRPGQGALQVVLASPSIVPEASAPEHASDPTKSSYVEANHQHPEQPWRDKVLAAHAAGTVRVSDRELTMIRQGMPRWAVEQEAANRKAREAASKAPRRPGAGRSAPDQFSVPFEEQRRQEVEARANGLRGKLMRLADLASMPASEPLIKGVLDLASESWLIGQSGGFKSFVAIDWACHVAAGVPEWRGRKVTAGDVLYVVAEGARGFAKRVKAWSQRHGAQPERLHILPVPVQARGETNRDLGAEWLTLIDMARELQPALVVLDTQARMTVGLEENSATDMGLWVKAVGELKDATEACVLVVHHTGRNGGDARGSSAIDAAQDVEWKVERKPHQLQATLRCDKSKDGDDRQRFTFAMDVEVIGQDADGQDITSLVVGDALDDASGQEGLAVLDAIADEGKDWNNQDWIIGTLERMAPPDGSGLTQAELRRLVDEARKRAVPALAPMNISTFKSTVRRLLTDERLLRLGARVAVAPEPFDSDEA